MFGRKTTEALRSENARLRTDLECMDAGFWRLMAEAAALRTELAKRSPSTQAIHKARKAQAERVNAELAQAVRP